MATSAAATLRSQNVDRIYDRRLETGTKDAQRGHICRSTSIFLISAMALAGLRPFGQAAAAIVLALLAFGATLLRHVPQAALGGVLLFVALRIIRVRQTVAIYRQSFGEFLLIVSTTAAIIVLPIEQGVAIGIALSLLNGIWSTTRARVLVFERVPGTTVWWPPSPHSQGEKEPNVIVAGFQAPLSFLNAYRFRRDILDALPVLDAEGAQRANFGAPDPLRVRAVGRLIPFGGGRSVEEPVQQLLERVFSRPPGRRRGVEIDR